MLLCIKLSNAHKLLLFIILLYILLSLFFISLKNEFIQIQNINLICSLNVDFCSACFAFQKWDY